MSFSENLKKARKRAKLSQRDLAAKSGVSQQAISVIENGGRSPSESTMKLLASALGCTVGELADDIDVTFSEFTLTSDEMQLVRDYRNLNNQGKEYIRQTIYMALPIYKRHIDIPVLEDQV